MSWRDKLLPASFRGVPFSVENVDTGVGRRTVMHQYPFRDEPYIEDMGPDADEFGITGYVIQDSVTKDYFDKRNRLIEALRQAGSGTLIHPFLGQMTVSLIGKARITESFSEGGMARFNMTFSQTGLSTLKSISTDNVSALDELAETAIDSIADNFADTYVHDAKTENKMISCIKSAYGMVKKTALSVKNSISPTVHAVIKKIDEKTNNISTAILSATDLINDVIEIQEEIVKLIGIPDSLIKATIGSYSGRYQGELVRLPEDPIPGKLGTSIIYALIALNRFGEVFGIDTPSIYGGQVDSISITSYSTAIASLNQMIFTNMVRNDAIVIATRVAARTDYDSYEDALYVTNMIADAMDSQLEKMGEEATIDDYSPYGLSFSSENSFLALEDLRSIFVKTMRRIGASLAHEIEYTIPPQMFTALQLAYDRYKDITRDEEIVARNYPIISHPGMLPTGLTISILSQ